MELIFIHVPNHEALGWVLERAVPTLLESWKRIGAKIVRWDVATLSELEQRFAGLTTKPLLFPNAYAIDDDAGQPVSLIEALERWGYDVLGSGSDALAAVLDKHVCQKRLRDAEVPVPAFVGLRGDEDNMEAQLAAAQLPWPALVKPACASGSLGIDDSAICSDAAQAAARVRFVATEIGGPSLVEQFLPGADITVATLFDGERWLLVPTWHEVSGRDPRVSVLGLEDRLHPWSADRLLRVIDEPHLRAQIAEIVPWACRTLGIRDVCRVDGRVDAEGQFRVIELNGMPGLEHPVSELVHQLAVADELGLASFDRLMATIGCCVGRRCGREPTPQMEALSYFAKPPAGALSIRG